MDDYKWKLNRRKGYLTSLTYFNNSIYNINDREKKLLLNKASEDYKEIKEMEDFLKKIRPRKTDLYG